MNSPESCTSTKTCTKCGVNKSLDNYAINRLGKFGRRADCRSCFAKHKKGYRQAVKSSAASKVITEKTCSKCRLLKPSQCFALDSYSPDKLAGRCKECSRARCRNWQQSNKDKDCARVSRRRATQLKATPGWASEIEMALFYRRARELTESTGTKHVVDHIVPLQSELVCGLHVQSNLKVISHTDNSSKGNRWWPDMPGDEE